MLSQLIKIIPRHALTVAWLAVIYCVPMLRAATEATNITTIGNTSIILDVPYPFVESSKLLPEIFAQRKKAMANTNQLIAWYVPAETLRELLNEKAARYRSLQVQVLRAMEEPSYSALDIAAFRDDLKKGAANMAEISEENVETIFNVYDLSELKRTAGTQRVLGVAELLPGSFTLCIATSVEGIDRYGGHEIETSISAVTYLLIHDKVILLSISGPEVSAKELRNAFRITKAWAGVLRELNPPPKNNNEANRQSKTSRNP